MEADVVPEENFDSSGAESAFGTRFETSVSMVDVEIRKRRDD